MELWRVKRLSAIAVSLNREVESERPREPPGEDRPGIFPCMAVSVDREVEGEASAEPSWGGGSSRALGLPGAGAIFRPSSGQCSSGRQ